MLSHCPVFFRYFPECVDVNKGKEIHGYVIRKGIDADVYIGSSLVDMYAKSARIEDSERVFSHLLITNI